MNDQITMALATVRDAGSLPVTWNNIEECTAEILRWKNTIGLGVIRIGQALLWAKERLRHGEFDAWLRDKVEFSRSSATNFMRIAREVEESSSLARLPYTKVLALLDVPKAEREAFAAAHDAEHATAAELKRLAKELADEKKRAEGLEQKVERQQSVIRSHLEEIDTAYVRINDAEIKLREAREELSAVRGELALVKARPAEVVEKLPDDYVELKQRLAKAEADADRMADELDQMKARQLESDMSGEPDIASRVISAIGGFMTQAAQMPQRIRSAGDCVDDTDINILLGQLQTVRTWCDALRDALLDQPRLSRR